MTSRTSKATASRGAEQRWAGAITALAFSAGGRLMATANSERGVQVWVAE